MQVKHALNTLQGGNPRIPPHQRKHDKRKERDPMLEAPEAQRPLDRPKPEQTPAPTLGPTMETTRIHRVAALSTGTQRTWRSTLTFQIKEQERRWAQTERSLFTFIERNIEAAFGFVADPCLSTKHNASNYLSTMPLWLYFQRPTTMAFHDLTTRLKPPKNLRSLLSSA
jgi:hypothetical protein